MEPKAYKSGDIVWVLASKRLGWWPARVENVDLLRSDFKKEVSQKTLAVVKYLNEDNYHFIEDAAIICAYNSSCKEEYISLGMKKYFEKKRINEASSTFMKFPTDIKQAEILTGGNPNIVDNERFQPKKPVPAQAKYKDIFVDPRAKEPKTKSPAINASSPRKPGRPAKDSSPTAKVNHPRFAGKSDHEVRIRKQDNSPSPVSSLTSGYKCDSCDFQTTRLNLMVIHQKMHLNGTGTQQQQQAQKPGQKRTISPPKKVANKRTKKTPETEGDLFDQVKRTLEAKESSDSKASPQPKKTSKASVTPKTPRTPRTAKTSPTALSASNKSSSVKASDSKTQFNPKKKWLKSSLQKEANPEVKIKLMADWDDEDDEHEKSESREKQKPDPPKPVVSEESMRVESDSDQEIVPVKSGLLQRRSDDEDDDSNVETETETKKEKSLDAEQVSKALDSPERQENKECTDEPFAGITAEINRLNANLEAEKGEEEESSRPAEENSVKEDTQSTDDCQTKQKTSMKSDEEIRQELVSLLAETSVPVLPDLSNIAKQTHDEAKKDPSPPEESTPEVQIDNAAQADAPNEEVVQNGVEAVVAEEVEGVVAHQIAVVGGEVAGVVTNGVEEEAASGNGNILMQVEGGETYMVVWEPGSNIQELLACSAEGEDGTPGATQTLLIDPSSLQAGSELENLFQMAVAASAAPTPPNEQSNPTQANSDGKISTEGSLPKEKGTRTRLTHEQLIKKHGNAVSRGLEANAMVWACMSAHLFVPAAVVDAVDAKTLTVAAFDVQRPSNTRKYTRKRVIPAFNHELNMEILAFCRSRNKAAINAKLNQSFDYAREFVRVKQMADFKELTIHQYLTCCHRSPVKLFSDRYLNAGSDDELVNIPEPLNDSDSMDETDPEDCLKHTQIVEKLVNEHVLTDECLEHLARYVKRPSERMKLYEAQKWSLLSQLATSGILENSQKLYFKLADYLTHNVHRVREFEEGKDHKRAFVLDVLLPEALAFGVQKTFAVSKKEAANIVVFGLKSAKSRNYSQQIV